MRSTINSAIFNNLATKNELSTEVTRATNAEALLATKVELNTEVTRATSAEALLATKVELNTEVTRATNSEALLATNVAVQTITAVTAITTADSSAKLYPVQIYSTIISNTYPNYRYLNILNYDGWTFIKTTGSSKINWYDSEHAGVSLSNIGRIACHFYCINPGNYNLSTQVITPGASARKGPIFTIYIAKSGSQINAVDNNGIEPSWYAAKLTYITSQSFEANNIYSAQISHPLIGTPNIQLPQLNNHIPIEYELASEPATSVYKDVNGNSVITPDSKILYIAIGSDSSSTNFGFSIKTLDVNRLDKNIVTRKIFRNTDVYNDFVATRTQQIFDKTYGSGKFIDVTYTPP